MRVVNDLVRVRAGLLALFVVAIPLQANFHAWQVAEIYSNADGTVQFVELFCDDSGETELSGQRLYCSKGSQTNSFTFPGNLSGETLNKRLLLATAGFGSLPGGVPPNYILPANFVFLGSGKINYANIDALNYSNLPTNGVRSLVRSGASFVTATNSPRNFAGQSGSIVPVRILSGVRSGTNFLISFATATGKNYTVQYKGALTNTAWQNGATVTGSGAIKTVTNTATASERFHRLRAQ
jgi:hypothetical protein